MTEANPAMSTTIMFSMILSPMKILESIKSDDNRKEAYIKFKFQTLPISFNEDGNPTSLENEYCRTVSETLDLYVAFSFLGCQLEIKKITKRFARAGLILPSFSASFVQQVSEFVSTAALNGLLARHNKVTIQVTVYNTALVNNKLDPSLCSICMARMMNALQTTKLNCKHLLKDDVCAICLDKFPTGVYVSRMPCFHVFHTKCVITWFTTKTTCPTCRNQVYAPYNHALC